LRAVLRGQAERVAADLKRQGKGARTVTLKLRFPPFETLTRSATPGPTLELADEIFEVAADLFEKAWAQNAKRPVRLLGVGVMNIGERARQLRLGEDASSDHLADTVADLRERFGDAVIHRAAEIGSPYRHP
jgi:DNA polymerase-4